MIKQALTHFIAGLFGLMATSVLAGIGILIVSSSQSILSLFFAVIFIAGGLFLGYKVYSTAVHRGIVNFMTSVNASPDLDNLEPSANSNHKKYDLRDFTSAFAKKENLFLKGSQISVWGNHTFPGFGSNVEIKDVKSDDQKTLEILFGSGNKLKIRHPQNIIEGRSYFKILNCEKVEWRYLDPLQNKFVSIIFERPNNHIKVTNHSNILVKWDSFQPGEPSVVLL